MRDTGRLVIPKGSVGHRWDKETTGNWNMKFENTADDSPYDPVLTLLDIKRRGRPDDLHRVRAWTPTLRGVPVKRYIDTVNGRIPVTTVYDLIMAQYGVDRGLDGAYPADYTDKDAAYTPAWQELFTGVDSKTVLQFAREWANTADPPKASA